MKKITALLFILLAVSACSAEQYGAGADKALPAIKIRDVILDPAYNGKTVTIEGKISAQCRSSGCWFFLNDGSGQILVDLSPKGFTLPPRMGKTARVTGTAIHEQGHFRIVALGVDVN